MKMGVTGLQEEKGVKAKQTEKYGPLCIGCLHLLCITEVNEWRATDRLKVNVLVFVIEKTHRAHCDI